MIDIEMLKNSVRVNFAIVKTGTGLLPCNKYWEDSKHSANAMIIHQMNLNGFSQDKIMDEMGVTMTEFKPMLKALNALIHTERWKSKVALVRKSYMDSGGDLDIW